MIRPVLFAAGALLLSACAGPKPAVPGAAAAAPVITDDNAPGWARGADSSDAQGHRFICEGQGSNEADAISSASGICEDKICKLCGVEVESVVQTKETLTGVEMQRQVVERCRRVRSEPLSYERKSVDCGPAGCTAWVRVYYSNESRDKECSRLTDENFIDPAECQNTIEAFKNVAGYTAVSFAQRTELLDKAIAQCGEIDVRPTPLIDSLNQKLDVGMHNFNKRPANLSRRMGFPSGWLADHAPLWATIWENPKFVDRIRQMRDFLQHKYQLMMLNEALANKELRTPTGIQRLMEALRALPSKERYGIRGPHWRAALVLSGSRRLLVDVTPVTLFLREVYPPERVREQHWDLRDLTSIFANDGVVDDGEWSYILATDYGRNAGKLLKANLYSDMQQRTQRFFEALDLLAPRYTEGKKRNLMRRLMQRDIPFVLAVEEGLAKRDGPYDWDFLRGVLEQNKTSSDKERRSIAERAQTASKRDKPECNRIEQHVEILDSFNLASDYLDGLICKCMEEEYPGSGVHTVNKGFLYERALLKGLSCVLPPSS